mgnify:FL=1
MFKLKSQVGNVENYTNDKSKGAAMDTKPMQAMRRAIPDEFNASQRFALAKVAAETNRGVLNNAVASKNWDLSASNGRG